MMEASNVIRALSEVPEARLRLIDLSWQVFRDGTLDGERAALFSREMEEAIAEAQAYVKATKEAVWALRAMGRS